MSTCSSASPSCRGASAVDSVMFVDFFYQLRQARIPVTIREYLMLLEAMEKGAAGISVDEFYVLARAAMVKDEKFFDTYDKVFGNFFRGAMNATETLFDPRRIARRWWRGCAGQPPGSRDWTR